MARAAAHVNQLHLPFVESCLENFPCRPGIYAQLFETPWEESPRTLWFCSDACEQAYCSSGEFDYTSCEGCDRRICDQNPRNGWHIQFRDHESLGQICLRCYQEEILENGQSRSDFLGDQIKGGMFFSWGNEEPRAAGFEEVTGFVDYFVDDRRTVRRYNSRALSLIDDGHAVLTAYERIGLGLEGYITLMSKPAGEGP